MKTVKITIQIDLNKIRKRVPPTGGPMKAKRGKGAYRRKSRDNSRWAE